MRIEFASKKKAKPAKAKSSHTKVSKKKPSITSGGHSHTTTKKKSTKNVGGSHTKPAKKKAPSSKIKKPAPPKVQVTPPAQTQENRVVAPAAAAAHFTSMDELLTFMTGIDGTGRVNAAVDDAVEHGFAPGLSPGILSSDHQSAQIRYDAGWNKRHRLLFLRRRIRLERGREEYLPDEHGIVVQCGQRHIR